MEQGIFDDVWLINLSNNLSEVSENISEIPTNPMLDSEDGSSFDAIPDMAKDSTSAKEATVLKDMYGGAIHIDTYTGAAGQIQGENGLPENPSSNLTDAHALATALGVRKYIIKTTAGIPLVLEANYTLWEFEAPLGGQAIINLNAQPTMGALTFTGLTVIGDGNAIDLTFKECRLSASNFCGTALNCLIATIQPNNFSNFVNCKSFDVLTFPAVLDFVLSDTSKNKIYFTNFEGRLTVKNMEAGDFFYFNSNCGELIIDPSCTGGSISRSGVHKISDLSGGAVAFDNSFITNGSDLSAIPDMAKDSTVAKDATVAKESSVMSIPTNPMLSTEDGSSFDAIPDMAKDSTVAKEATVNKSSYQNGAVWIDTINGTAGQGEDIGTPGKPSSNLTDAHAIATREGLRKYMFLNTGLAPVALEALYNNWEFEAVDRYRAIILVMGNNGDNCTFKKCFIVAGSGVDDTKVIQADDCVLGLGSAWIVMKNCQIQAITPATGPSSGENCWSSPSSPCNIDYLASEIPSVARNLHLTKASGVFTIANMETGDTLYIASDSCTLTIDASCTGGDIYVSGKALKIKDNASGAVTINYQYASRGEELTEIPDMAKDSTVAKAATTGSADSSGTYAYQAGTAEETVVEISTSTRKTIQGIWLDLVNITQDGTIKLYYKIDGTNYREFDSRTFTVATDSDGVYINLNMGITNNLKVTYKAGVTEGVNKDICYSIIYDVKE